MGTDPNMANATWTKYPLQFKRPSGTSRGVLTQKTSYFLIWKDQHFPYPALGECSLIEGLSPDPMALYEEKLNDVCRWLNGQLEQAPDLGRFPSIAFGLEMLLMDLEANGTKVLFKHAFTEGREGIQINGLIWMGDAHSMRQQIEEKIDLGFKCVKLKIGAIDLQSELDLLRFIRDEFGDALELRVDANGAFSPAEALNKLDQLAQFKLHSIEQPIAQGQWEAMANVCERSPIPIALDEELIGISNPEQKKNLLTTICPRYIILKPSLHGGFKGSEEWIAFAQQSGCEWWMTSALESNVGLSAIAQWAFEQNARMPQGLGTGGLYTNNVDSPLYLQGQNLWFDPNRTWDLEALLV